MTIEVTIHCYNNVNAVIGTQKHYQRVVTADKLSNNV